MDSIEHMLGYMESGTVGQRIEGEQPHRLFDAIDKLERSPKDFLGFYNTVKQYSRHQLTRGNFIANTNTEAEDIKISIINGD